MLLTMAPSNETLVNNAFNQVAHLLSDVGNLKSLPAESKERMGFAKFSKLFCDSIIFWGLYNHADERSKGTAIGKYIAELRDAFNHTALDVESILPMIAIMESAEVRKSLGSRMEDLVEKETTFARRVKRYKKNGYTRVELTFYGPSLRPLQEYQDEMDKTRELLKECRSYKCSFETQWQERAKCITSMAAVYFPKEEVFAYCHWWNSLTSKKYGYTWNKLLVREKECFLQEMYLLAVLA
ncbi:hypothetical protein K457DRAFT_1825778 [Linnemannia elongata AG-77]|uniref:Uncharacterized protein n=1 Tax=Linnemannia elongata AG-77 TaxID=1314771 RepID=A0A197JAE8_9FUNG|nr:hypothetical protein K457DRAFT_1825778 [Linnemannia elongata AG-77]